METLSDQLTQATKAAQKEIPAKIMQELQEGIEKLKSSGIESKALKVGAKAPNFTLFNQFGESRTLGTILTQGPLVLNFYRGGW